MRQFEIATTIMLNLEEVAHSIKDLVKLKAHMDIDIDYHNVSVSYHANQNDKYFIYTIVEINYNLTKFTLFTTLSTINTVSDYCVKVANKFIEEANKH